MQHTYSEKARCVDRWTYIMVRLIWGDPASFTRSFRKLVMLPVRKLCELPKDIISCVEFAPWRRWPWGATQFLDQMCLHRARCLTKSGILPKWMSKKKITPCVRCGRNGSPDVGARSDLLNLDRIREHIQRVDSVFITLYIQNISVHMERSSPIFTASP